MIQDDLRTKLECFEASIDNNAADGDLLEELVEQCAPDIPDWEVADCWLLADCPHLAELGIEPTDDGIDLIAKKADGANVAIQCKAFSDSNITTTMIQKFAGKANGFSERWLVTTAQQTAANARTLSECKGAFPISRSRAHTHRRHGHPLQTVPSAGLIERPQEKNRVDALR